MASLPGINLFSSLPTTPPPNDPSRRHHNPPKPPIPIPKYPPTLKSQRKYPPQQTPKPQSSPAFKTFHRRSKYYKPVKEGVISSDGDRSVVVGESGVSYQLPGAPFEFQFSYSETPKVKPLAIREPAFLPFAPPTMPRPWTGKAPLKKRDKKIKLFDSFRPESDSDGGAKKMEMLKPYKLGNFEMKPREKVLGAPLSKEEIKELLRRHMSSNRQVNLGRDGLTHNMLELIHSHWRRVPVCKVRCLGVPTVDMNNVCRCLEEKTGGKIIHRVGGIAYLFRGRLYDPKTRPRYPVMLWKPATPVYPKLIQEAPEGLTKTEADELRMKGKNLRPICKLAKNGVYVNLLKEVKQAFEGSILVKIDCKGLHASDYKKIGAKLKELVPCVLLSFDDEQILMWRGHGWKSMYQGPPLGSNPFTQDVENDVSCSENTEVDSDDSETKMVRSSPKMLRLWKQALESNRALLLDDIALGPDDLLKVVDEFEITSQAIEHTYPAVIVSSEDDQTGESEDECSDDEYYIDDSLAPLGSLPVDSIVTQLNDWDNEQWKSNRNWR